MSNTGKVRRLRHEEVYFVNKVRVVRTRQQMTFRDGCKGYHVVTLSDGKRKRTTTAHRLVSEAFLGSCPTGQEVRHLNGKKRDSRLGNLLYGTHKQNLHDALNHGTLKIGEDLPWSKLTEHEVKKIRRLHVPYRLTRKMLAQQFGVSESTIARVIQRKLWRHVP